ncbi:ABC transporter permease [Candidatus Heimdallarchaeota archaeon B3_Heim]|nr:MAG: ABC transporter permease [Candidatus Heimdallarchaeota archaeon B3_Heim]
MTISTVNNGSGKYSTPSLFKRYKIRFTRFWHLYTDSPFGMIGMFLVLLFVTMGVFAPILAPYDPNKTMVGERSDNPSASHPLGTDRLGRDIFSQMIYGAQISLLIGLSAAFISLVIGTLFGLVSGYYGGWIDIILMRITDFFIQLPTLPLMLVVVSLFGGGMENLILIIGLLGWTGTARIVRSETLSIKQRAFVEASKSVGAGNRHIISSHILPNVFPLIFANAILGVVNSIIAEAGLSFLGFGVVGSWSWGRVLYEAGRENAILLGAWWHFIPPGISIMLLALGFSLISFSLNEVLNPRLRER